MRVGHGDLASISPSCSAPMCSRPHPAAWAGGEKGVLCIGDPRSRRASVPAAPQLVLFTGGPGRGAEGDLERHVGTPQGAARRAPARHLQRLGPAARGPGILPRPRRPRAKPRSMPRRIPAPAPAWAGRSGRAGWSHDRLCRARSARGSASAASAGRRRAGCFSSTRQARRDPTQRRQPTGGRGVRRRGAVDMDVEDIADDLLADHPPAATAPAPWSGIQRQPPLGCCMLHSTETRASVHHLPQKGPAAGGAVLGLGRWASGRHWRRCPRPVSRRPPRCRRRGRAGGDSPSGATSGGEQGGQAAQQALELLPAGAKPLPRRASPARSAARRPADRG